MPDQPQWIVVTDPDGEEHRFPADEYNESQAIQEVRRLRGEDVNEGALGDFGTLLHSGIGALTSSIGGGLDFFGLDAIGQPFQDVGTRIQRRASTRFSPDLARDLEEPGIQGGDIYSTVVQSAPSTLTIMGPGIGLNLASRARGLSGLAALGRPVSAGLEGVQSAGGASQNIEESVRALALSDPEAFASSELGARALEEANGDYGQAVEIAAENANGVWPLLIGSFVGAVGLRGVDPGDLLRTQAGQRGAAAFVLNLGKRSIQEGLEETIQSAGEQLGLNAAVMGVDQDVGLFDHVPDASILGGIAGGIGGGTFGATESGLQALLNRQPLQQDPGIEDALNTERERVLGAYDEAEAAPEIVEGPTQPVPTPEPPVMPRRAEDPDRLDEAIFNFSSTLEDGDDEELRQATSDLITALAEAGVPPDQIQSSLASPSDLLGLAEELAATRTQLAEATDNMVAEQDQRENIQPRSDVANRISDGLPAPAGAADADIDTEEEEEGGADERPTDGGQGDQAGAVDDNQGANPRAAYWSDPANIEDAYRAREEAVAADDIESYEAAQAALEDAADFLFGADYTTAYRARHEEAVAADDEQLAIKNETGLATDIENHLVSNGMLQDLQEVVPGAEAFTDEDIDRDAERTDSERRQGSSVAEERGVHSPEVGGAIPPPDSISTPEVPFTEADLTALREIEEPGELDAYVAERGWTPDQLKASRDAMPVAKDGRAVDLEGYQALTDAWRAAQKAQKKKTAGSPAPKQSAQKPTAPLGEQRPKTQLINKPEPAPAQEAVSKISPFLAQGLRDKGAKLARNTKNYHPNTLSEVLRLVNDAREELGEPIIGPASKTPANYENRAEWLVDEAQRLSGLAEPAVTPAQFPEDKIRDRLADTNLAVTGKKTRGESTDPVGISRKETLGLKTSTTGQMGASRDKATPEADEPRGSQSTSAAEPSAGEVGGRGPVGPATDDEEGSAPPQEAQEETEDLAETAEAKAAEHPGDEYDTPTPSDISLIDIMAEAGQTKRGTPFKDRGIRSAHQGAAAFQIGNEFGFDQMVDALNAVEGVFDRMRAAQFVAPYLTDEQRAELRERLHGFGAVQRYLDAADTDLWSGPFMANNKEREARRAMRDWRREIGLTRGARDQPLRWAAPERTGVKSMEEREFMFRFLKEAAIPALDRLHQIQNGKRGAAGERELEVAERDYQSVLQAVLTTVTNDLTVEMRADLFHRETGWLQTGVETGKLSATVAGDLFNGAASNLYGPSDWRQYNGRDSGPLPVYNTEYQAKKQQLALRLNQYLKQLGVGDLAGRMVDVVRNPDDLHPIEDASAAYTSKLLVIAMGGDDASGYVPLAEMSLEEAWKQVKYRADHELIHAMRQLGILSENDFEILRKFAATHGVNGSGEIITGAESFLKGVQQHDFYKEVLAKYPASERTLIMAEESVAIAFQNLNRIAPSRPKTILGKIGKVLRAIQRALRIVGLTHPDQIYANAQDIAANIMDGKVGRRKRDYVAGLESASAIVSRIKENPGTAVFMPKKGPGRIDFLRTWIRSLRGEISSKIDKPETYAQVTGPEEDRVILKAAGLDLQRFLDNFNGPRRELIEWAEIAVDLMNRIETMAEETGGIMSANQRALLDRLYYDYADALVNNQRLIQVLGNGFWEDGYLQAMYLAIKTYQKPFAEITPEEFERAFEAFISTTEAPAPDRDYLYMAGRGSNSMQSMERLLAEIEKQVVNGNLKRGWAEAVEESSPYSAKTARNRLTDMRNGVFGQEMQDRALAFGGAQGGGEALEDRQDYKLLIALDRMRIDRDAMVERVNALREEMKLPPIDRAQASNMIRKARIKNRKNDGQLFMARGRKYASEGLWHPSLFGAAREYELNPLQMYSQAEKAALEFPEARSTKQHMRKWLGHRVKKAELDWIQIDELLGGRGTDKVTRQELIDFVRSRKLRLTAAYYYGRGDDPAAKFSDFTMASNYKRRWGVTPSSPPSSYSSYTLLGDDTLDHNYMEVAAVIQEGQPGSESSDSHVGPEGTVWAFLANDLPVDVNGQEMKAYFINQGQSDLHGNGSGGDDPYQEAVQRIGGEVFREYEQKFTVPRVRARGWKINQALAKRHPEHQNGYWLDEEGSPKYLPDVFAGVWGGEDVSVNIDDPYNLSRDTLTETIRKWRNWVEDGREKSRQFYKAMIEGIEQKKPGYQYETIEKVTADFNESKQITQEWLDWVLPEIEGRLQKWIAENKDSAPAEAPLKETWPEAMFRHAFMMALSSGHDALAWASADLIRSYPAHASYKGDFYDKRWPPYVRKWLSQYGGKVHAVNYDSRIGRQGRQEPTEELDELSMLVDLAASELNTKYGDHAALLQRRRGNPKTFREIVHDAIIDGVMMGESTEDYTLGELAYSRAEVAGFSFDDQADISTKDKLTIQVQTDYVRDFANKVSEKIKAQRTMIKSTKIYVMPITDAMRTHFLQHGAQLFMARGPHTVQPSMNSRKYHRQDAISRRMGIQPPTAAGFSAARKPGQSFIGQQPRERVRQVVELTRRYGTPEHWSKRTARQLVTFLADTGRNWESSSPNFTLGQMAGKALKHFAYGITTLGNLPGQGYYLTLRSRLMGDINAGIDHAERLNKLSERMTDEDYEQYQHYMLTRDASPEEIKNPDVRAAAVLSKDLLEKFGEENVRVGRMSERQLAKYQGRYLPRKYFRYIENSLRTTGIRLGGQGYFKERLPGRDRQIFGALDLAGHTGETEALRKRLVEMLGNVSEADRTRTGMYLTGKLRSPRTINDAGIRHAIHGIRTRLREIEAHVDSLDLITMAPNFPRGKDKDQFGPYQMKKRFGENYVAAAFWRAAKRNTSIGRVLEQSAVDAQITDPIVLSATAIAEQNRDLAVYHFFKALEYFQDASGLDVKWLHPDQMVTWQGRTMTVLALKDILRQARENFHLNQHPMMRQYAEEQIAEMAALVETNEIQDSAVGDEYIRLPDTAAYGDMRGLIVHRAIYNDLKGTLGVGAVQQSGAMKAISDGWGSFMSFFKQAMTTLNIPKGHARALFQNVATSYFSGVGGHDLGLVLPSLNLQTWGWYIKALGYMEQNHELWLQAQELGVRSGTFTTTELRHAYGLVHRLKVQERMASGDQTARIQAVLDMAEGFKGIAADMFNFWDTWARFTKFVHEVESKKAAHGDAMIEAFEWAPDYSLVPDWIRALRTTVVPFATFRYKLTPKFVDQVSRLLGHARRGELVEAGDIALRLAAPMMLWSGVTSMGAAALLGMDDREHRALRASMSRYFRENPGVVPLPIRDSQGNIVLVDLGIMYPWTQTIQAAQAGLRGEAVSAAGLMGVGIPAADVWAAWKTGVDPYTGMPLYPDTATEAEKNIAYAAFLMNYVTPPPLRGLIDPLVGALTGNRVQLGSGEFARTIDALWGDGLTVSGKPIEDPAYLAARFITGFNFNSMDVRDQINRNLRQLEYELDGIDRAESSARRDYGNRSSEIRQRRGLSTERREELIAERRRAYRATIERLEERRAQLRRELREYVQEVRPIRQFENEEVQ